MRVSRLHTFIKKKKKKKLQELLCGSMHGMCAYNRKYTSLIYFIR